MIHRRTLLSKYNDEFLEHMADTVQLIFNPLFLKRCLLLLPATVILYKVGSGVLFIIFLTAVCILARSAKLGGLFGWFIVSVSVFIYYNDPVSGHYIEYLLRAPARGGSNQITSIQVQENIPTLFSSKLFWSLVFGVRGGFVPGAGLGLIGRKAWGYHPKL